MSRSRRKPYFRETNKRWAKKLANKQVRKYKHIPNGRWYRKIYDSWDIDDFGWYWPNTESLYRK